MKQARSARTPRPRRKRLSAVTGERRGDNRIREQLRDRARADQQIAAIKQEQEQLHEIVQGAACRVLEEQERTEAILSALGQGLFGLDACGCVQFINPACERMMGWAEDRLQGIIVHDLLHPPQQRHTPCSPDTCPLLQVLTHAVARRVDQDTFYRHDGSSVAVSYFCTPVYRSGEPIGALICFDDITERLAAAQALDEYARQAKAQNEQLFTYCDELTAIQRRLEQQAEELIEKNAQILEANLALQDLATTDGMTGLANHKAFQDTLRTVWGAGRAQSRVQLVSLLMVDVDKFKSYNDSFGHPAGDEVLKTVARLLRENMRDTDLVARYGGEEFVVVAWDAEIEDARRFAARICKIIEGYPFANRQVTVSIGIAVQDARNRSQSATSACYCTPDALIRAADQALYEAKRAGRNRVCAAPRLDLPIS